MAGVHRSVDMGFIPSIHRSGATRNAPDQAISVVSPERTDHRPTTEETTMKLQTRIAAGVVGIAAAAGIGLGAAGAAHAGTMPITRPGEPTVAMTITNHTDKPEYLIGSTAGQSGQWVNAPQRVLYPGASETVTAVAPFSNYLTANAQYPDRALRAHRQLRDRGHEGQRQHRDERDLGSACPAILDEPLHLQPLPERQRRLRPVVIR